ncbi:ABC transporter ATP-binding protein [Alloyangia pacifica]|uniref:Peptide/nickel transport system ATP-binding protein n=1 Tax=Alloyangia pacifica TaxID=311180 RepID=A0A1I6QQS4_9RHOB|nr:ABC transporter ATP-binding protein [Alloyangia pacifica]SDF95746.1 peptide/nickel transport system ATP-binding protein [Alloyangia pacifica]SFS54826.1 peptide/nickel transport system ATP-binding protein [Alloyangia pacifica]
MTNPLVSVRDLRIGATTDAGRKVEIIKGVSFDIEPGEIVALIGESGSGKTTIALSLMGHTRTGCRIDGGNIRLGTSEITAMSERARASVRGTEVSYVPQSAAAAFNPSKRIMEQVIEIAAIHELMPRAEAEKKAVELFRALALPDAEHIGQRYPHQVSGGQLQRLSAAMALIGDPKLVIFDEPTTALDVTTQIEVLRAFKSVMQKGGMAGVYVSHDLAVVAQIADRIIVLRGGEIQEVGSAEQILRAPQHPYTKQLLAAFEPVPHQPVDQPVQAAKPTPVLEVFDLCAGYGPMRDGVPLAKILKNVNFKLERGRNLGVIGESGSGKSTLARAIAGILPAYRGAVMVDGKELKPDLQNRSKDDLQRMQMVFQLADTALNPAHSIGSILARPLTFYEGLRGKAREARVIELLDMVHLPAALRHRLPGELSGGQKQRVNLARALAASPELILCDEITSALDTVVAAAILELLKELQRELGLSYMFISHDLSTVEAICDDVLVMYKGEVVEALPAARMSSEATHPYSRLLISSVPQLDTGWLSGLEQDPELVAQFANR